MIFEPASADLAAQTFRADLWGEHGWVLWNDAWYSGHLVPGYSLLYPPLGAVFGPRLVGALAAIAAAAAFAALVERHAGRRAATLAALWFAFGVAALLYTGRITFMAGLALGIGAVLSLPRVAPAVLLAAGAALASPVAGLFTALAGVALLFAGRVREGLALAAAATVATLALVLAFPVGGTQPFVLSSFWWAAAACLIAAALFPPKLRALRIGAGIYAALLIALYVVATPIGSNAPRLAALLLGPLAALTLLERRPRLLALVALPLLYWQLAAPVGDLLRGVGDPSTEATFYAPLLDQLDRRTAGVPARVEVPPTRERWESVYVAERYPLARGWMRQLESDDIDDFTDGALTPDIYRRWLIDHGVSYVALADADLDYIAEDEGELLKDDPPPYLQRVWGDDEWTLWEVIPPGGGRFVAGAALAGRGARITELGPDAFTVSVPGPGSYPLRVRYTSYFEVSGGACLSDAGEATSLLRVPGPKSGPQTIRVNARLSVNGLLGRSGPCSG